MDMLFYKYYKEYLNKIFITSNFNEGQPLQSFLNHPAWWYILISISILPELLKLNLVKCVPIFYFSIWLINRIHDNLTTDQVIVKLYQIIRCISVQSPDLDVFPFIGKLLDDVFRESSHVYSVRHVAAHKKLIIEIQQLNI